MTGAELAGGFLALGLAVVVLALLKAGEPSTARTADASTAETVIRTVQVYV